MGEACSHDCGSSTFGFQACTVAGNCVASPADQSPQASAADTDAPGDGEAAPALKRESHRPHSWREAFHHHALVALWVASLVGILHHLGVLAVLDATMLRLAGSASAQYTQSADTPAAANAAMPMVLLIGNRLYEEAFQLRSPFDRSRLAKILRQLRQVPGGAPQTLVLDIDVADTGHDFGQAELDRALVDLLGAGTRLILPIPAPVGTPSAIEVRAQWLRQACTWADARQLAFASPALTIHGGQVLQYLERNYSLGVAATGAAAVEPVCGRAAVQPAVLSTLVTKDLADHALQLETSGSGRAGYVPFNAGFFAALPAHAHVLDTLDAWPGGRDGQPLRLAGRTVFIGGGYGEDRYLTPLDPEGLRVEGVVLHAATYYSVKKPVTYEAGLVALLLDIVVGILAGYGFHALWQGHGALRQRAGWVGYAGSKLAFVATVAVALVASVALVWAAARWGYARNYWVSPGPVVLGVLAKLMIAGTQGNHHPAVPAPRAARWIESGALAAVAAANLVMIVLPH